MKTYNYHLTAEKVLLESYKKENSSKSRLLCVAVMLAVSIIFCILSFSYGKLHSYNGESGSSSDKFNTSPEKIRLSYIEDDNQECNHVWDSGVVIKAPTETTTGIKIYTCKICAETKKEIVPSTGKKEDKDSSSNNNNRQDNKSTLAPGTKITDQSSKAVYKLSLIHI